MRRGRALAGNPRLRARMSTESISALERGFRRSRPKRPNEPYDRGVVGKDADDVGPAFDLAVDPLEWVRRGELFAVGFRECHKR